jgi:hypothetical protein
MLRDGQFIKEPPPKIGSHYVPQFYQTVQERSGAIESENRWEAFYRKNISSFDVGAIMILMYVVLALVVTVLRELFHLLFG